MFWDKAANLYDIFEYLYNGEVNHKLCKEVESMVGPYDNVLECACGTGMISKYIGRKCKYLTATDYSSGMLKQAKKKCGSLPNVRFRKANIMNLKYKDNSFDKVVAGNVIHLLDNPHVAIKELERVCKKGGKIIIPTYINDEDSLFIKLIGKAGAGFKRQYSYKTYQKFFKEQGYDNVEYKIIKGKMPCAVAVITKR